MNRSFEAEFWNKRRMILQGVLGALGAVSFLGLSARSAKATKVSQLAVGYQPSPHGSEHCAKCRLFEPPHACAQVEGYISSQGWCRIWAAK